MLTKAPILTLMIIALVVVVSESKHRKSAAKQPVPSEKSDDDSNDQANSNISTKHKKNSKSHKNSKKNTKNRKERATIDDDDKIAKKTEGVQKKITVIIRNFFKRIADASTCFRQDFDKTECGKLADECYKEFGFFSCVKLLECAMKVSRKCTQDNNSEPAPAKDLGNAPPPLHPPPPMHAAPVSD